MLKLRRAGAAAGMKKYLRALRIPIAAVERVVRINIGNIILVSVTVIRICKAFPAKPGAKILTIKGARIIPAAVMMRHRTARNEKKFPASFFLFPHPLPRVCRNKRG